MSSNVEHVEEPEQHPHSGDVRRVAWLRTMISLEKTLYLQWPVDSQGAFHLFGPLALYTLSNYHRLGCRRTGLSRSGFSRGNLITK